MKTYRVKVSCTTYYYVNVTAYGEQDAVLNAMDAPDNKLHESAENEKWEYYDPEEIEEEIA